MPLNVHKPLEYSVYDSFLVSLYPRGFTHLVIACATVPPEFFDAGTKDFIRQELPSVWDDTLTDFERVSGQVVALELEYFARAPDIRFTSRVANESYGIADIRADFPEGDGIVYLSRVGFSNDGSQALGTVDYFAHRSFPNMGFGFYLLSTQVEGTWQVTDKTQSWIA